MGGLEGSAVTAVRIAGINHEYATIPGVREDVLDILLNCKQLSINSSNPELEIGRLVASGPMEVKANDIQFSSQVEIVDGEKPIATIQEGHNLELEIHVERGVGYRPVDRKSEETTAIDLLQIDAVFMPVKRVNFTIDETAVAEGGIQTPFLRPRPKFPLRPEPWLNLRKVKVCIRRHSPQRSTRAKWERQP